MRIDRYFKLTNYCWVDEQNKSIHFDYLISRYKDRLFYGQYINNKFEHRDDIVSIIPLKIERYLKYKKIFDNDRISI